MAERIYTLDEADTAASFPTDVYILHLVQRDARVFLQRHPTWVHRDALDYDQDGERIYVVVEPSREVAKMAEHDALPRRPGHA